MKILSTVIFAILCAAAVLGQDDNNSTTTEVTTDNVTSTTLSPTESTNTTFEPEPTSTTLAPEPTTPTVKPTTLSTSSSTVTTTATPPHTTKAPKPTAPTPDECSWNVTVGNVTCIRAVMKAVFSFSAEGETQYVALSPNATTEGSTCHLTNDTQQLVVQESNYSLTMIFAKEENKVYVNETIFVYRGSGSPVTGSSDSKLFTVKAGNSYMCKSQVNVKLDNITMELYELHVQAFGVEGNTNFGSAEECEADDKVSDAVPIAVGCALAALIIIVLIAYLVGRRQSRQRGYQSV